MVLTEECVKGIPAAGGGGVEARPVAVERRVARRVPRHATTSLFAWHRGRWGLPRAAVLRDISGAGAAAVVGTRESLRPNRAYALRLPQVDGEPLWLMCAVAWQEELGGGLTVVGLRFTSEIVHAAA